MTDTTQPIEDAEGRPDNSTHAAPCEICAREGTRYYKPPTGPADRAITRLIHLQKARGIGPLVRLYLKWRSIDIPPRTLTPGTGLVLRHVGNVVVHVGTRIGRDVMLHQNVTVGRSDIWRSPRGRLQFVLEDHVILGANAVVVGSHGTVRIGRGTVVGANSVLTQSTGDWEIWAGTPAQLVGRRDPADCIHRAAPKVKEAG